MFAETAGQGATTASTTAAVVAMVSFAIQQLLQLLDPWISRIPAFHGDGTNSAADKSAANSKKAVMGALSVVLGLSLVPFIPSLKLLFTNNDILNTIVSAFVVGAGTEASNTVQKLLAYTKDKIKTP